MLNLNFNKEGGIIQMIYTDTIRVPLYIKRKVKYKDFDINFDENGAPVIKNNNEIVDASSLDFNDNIEIYKNTNLLKTLVLLEETLLSKIDGIETTINKLDTEILLSFVEESKKIDSLQKRELLVNYITEKLLCEDIDNDISCRTIEIIRLLSKKDLENLQKLKSLLLNIPPHTHTVTKKIIAYDDAILPELSHDIELKKFCTVPYTFLKRLDTLGLISTDLMSRTRELNYVCVGSTCYKVVKSSNQLTMTIMYLSDEIKEIFSAIDSGEIIFENYKDYVEQTFKIKLEHSEFII